METRLTKEQIIGALRAVEAPSGQIRYIEQRHKITEAIFVRCRNRYVDMYASDARRLKVLEAEIGKRKTLPAGHYLVIDLVTEFSQGK